MRVYKRKNGRISEISKKMRSCSFYRFDVPNFFQNCDAMVTEFKAEVADPTVTVRSPDTTVAVQDKYARMLVLQGHCPLVPGL